MSKPCLAPLLIATIAFTAAAQAAPPAHDHEHHGHATESAAATSASQSTRWVADADLRKGMGEVHAALDDLAHYEMGHMPANMAVERAEKIEAAVSYIVTHCKLAPDADAALHKIIIPLQSAAQRLKKDSADVAAVAAMREAVANYPRQFDDPLWSNGKAD